jgi:hypothetical protein
MVKDGHSANPRDSYRLDHSHLQEFRRASADQTFPRRRLERWKKRKGGSGLVNVLIEDASVS